MYTWRWIQDFWKEQHQATMFSPKYFDITFTFWLCAPFMLLFLPFDILITIGYAMAKQEAGTGWWNTCFPKPVPPQQTEAEKLKAFYREIDTLPIPEEDRQAMKNTATWNSVEEMLKKYNP